MIKKARHFRAKDKGYPLMSMDCKLAIAFFARGELEEAF